MKKLLLLLFLASITMTSCVDKSYDLNKLEDSDITIGDEFIIPIGKMSLFVPDLLSKINPGDLYKAAGLGFITEEIITDYPLEFALDKEIVDKLAGGKQLIITDVENPIPDCIEFTASITFIDIQGNRVKMFENVKLNPITVKDGRTIIETEMTPEMLDQMTSTEKVSVKFIAKINLDEIYSVNLDKTLIINLRVKHSGGIKL